MANPIIGIDLGTTNSVVSILKEKLPQTILVDNAKLLPSVVCYTDSKFIVGQTAKNMAILEPENTVLSIKRKMGQDVSLKIGDREMRPEEISAVILKKIRDIVVEQFGFNENLPVRSVITVPAYFTEEQRNATKQAAEIAALQVERIINEPTAAALAFGMSALEEAVYAIYDLGGGTFDISIIESMDGLVEVLATKGNNELGGDDFDKLLMDFIWARFLKQNKIVNVYRTSKEEARLIRIAEQTKIKLSTEKVVAVQESFFFKNNGINYHLEMEISRAEFEGLIREKIQSTITLLAEALDAAKLKAAELDGIILVGGSSRIPLVTDMIQKKFTVDASLINYPDEAVSHGATIQGAIIDNQEIDTVLIDITPHSLGVAVMDDTTYSKLYSLSPEQVGKDYKPDLGAGVVIRQNTPIPTKKSQKFSASSRFQKKFEINVYQGEGKRYEDNQDIGTAMLEVKEPLEHGTIEVTFELDINGLLKITAEETTTKESVHAEFKSSKGVRVHKSQVKKEEMASKEESDNVLIRRAEKLLDNDGTQAEDKIELTGLIAKYQQKQEAGDQAALEETENELLDLLYYLEGNED